MSDKEKLSIGKELTDEELMEMTGGSVFVLHARKITHSNLHYLEKSS